MLTIKQSQTIDGFVAWNNQQNDRPEKQSYGNSEGLLGFNLSDNSGFII
jgi:hypothetical protein